MAYAGSRTKGIGAVLKRTKDAKVRALIQAAYEVGHSDGYMQALEEVM